MEIFKSSCLCGQNADTYSMVQSPFWEDKWFAASQEIPQNLKFHYRSHKRPPPLSILSQPSPVHIPTSHLLEIGPNFIHPSTLGLPSGLFPSGSKKFIWWQKWCQKCQSQQWSFFCYRGGVRKESFLSLNFIFSAITDKQVL